MNDMIIETADRLFADFAPAAFEALPRTYEAGAAPLQANIWKAIEDMGFPLACLSEEDGGYGLEAIEALAIVRLAGAHAIPVPLAETMLANVLLAAAGLPVAEGPATIAAGGAIEQTPDGWTVTGTVKDVPWGRSAQTVVVLGSEGQIARLSEGWTSVDGHNLASEQRDSLTFDARISAGLAGPSPVSPQTCEALGAMMRAQALAGALEATLAQCIAYTKERVQFGRPLAAFQVIQQNLAEMAGQVAAARAGADMAAAALPCAMTDPDLAQRLAGAAKLRAGEAASKVAWIAHQVHGAIGFTREFRLHPLTTRLWAWRDEFGSEAHWADRLGAGCLSGGASGFWPLLTQSAGVPQ